MNAFAADLAARFSPTVGCTRPWDSPDPTLFRVIIDNMMDLEVLFASYTRTGNSTLMACGIACRQNIGQPREVERIVVSCRGVQCDDWRGDRARYSGRGIATTVPGAGARRGVSIDSRTVSPGLLLLGGLGNFCIVFAHTKNMSYLGTSRKMATYFRDILPLDSVVPWCVKSSHHFRFSWFHDGDFDAPLVPMRPADTSGDDSDDGLAQQ